MGKIISTLGEELNRQASIDKLRELGLGRACERTFHDLRRTFIHDEMDRLIGKGHSKEEAAKIVAKEVGHNRTEVLRWYRREGFRRTLPKPQVS